MNKNVQFNLLNAPYEEFIAFLFDHEVVSIDYEQKDGIGPWSWYVDVEFDPVQIADLYIRLFLDPIFLISRFSKAHLEQGFSAMINCNLECAVSEIIWHKKVPMEIGKNCIRSMFNLFEILFTIQPLDYATSMWWDSLAFDWDCGIRCRSKGGEDEWMQDAMFETLEKILALDSSACQFAALHGLGHLNHPETQELIERYLESNKAIGKDMKEYALSAAQFDVM